MPRPAPSDDGTGEPGLTPRQAWIGFGLVLLLTVLLCLWAAFLVPLRVGTVRVPVSLLVAGAGNLLLGRAGGKLLGVPGVLVPGALWVALALLLGTRRSEGDLVVLGDTVGTLFLVIGALGFAAAYATTSLRREASPTPRAPAGR